MFMFYRHVGMYGPLSHGARWRQGVEAGGKVNPRTASPESSASRPEGPEAGGPV